MSVFCILYTNYKIQNTKYNYEDDDRMQPTSIVNEKIK